jgi:hypothetical protein
MQNNWIGTNQLYATLNQLFIAGSGPSTPSEYEQPGQVEVRVVEDIAAWSKNNKHCTLVDSSDT